jgi:hypothetical protein
MEPGTGTGIEMIASGVPPFLLRRSNRRHNSEEGEFSWLGKRDGCARFSIQGNKCSDSIIILRGSDRRKIT